jgi:uncharacterized protein (DUF433 family)
MAAVEIFPGVTSDPEIWSGKAMIKGTRIPVSLVLGQLSIGATFEELNEGYGLTEEQVQAALAYAEKRIEDELLYVTRP